MINKFKRLEELADRWKEFSLKVNGWETNYYYGDNGMEVLCYFSDKRDYINITIEGISVAYFSRKTFSNLTYDRLRRLDEIIKNYSTWIDRLKSEYTRKSQEKKEEERKKKIKYYEEKLKELKETL